jgi:hypothetical protein
MADRDLQPPVFGEQGEPCQECGAPLAADQRYCLNCGKRRTGPRVDYQRLIGVSGEDGSAPEQTQSAPPPSPAPAEPAKAERDYAPFAAVGGIAVLGLMLLVGVLIGKGNSSPAAAPAPIVKVGGETNTAGEAETDESKTAAAKPKAKKSKKGGGTGAKTVAGGITGGGKSDATVQASTDELENLSSQSGEDYEDTIKKLPDKIATPGKPPPVDTTKAPGGGGAAETIE